MLHSTFSSRCKPTFTCAIKFIAVCALSITVSGIIYAQTPDAKRALAVRAIAAQEGPEMQRMFNQLAGSAMQPVVERWNQRLAQLPPAKQEPAIKALDAELKKFNDDALQIISTQATKVRGDTLITAYTEKFNEEELKQLVALMEAPVFKKYQGLAPEIGGAYVKAIVEGTRDRITQRSLAFDAVAEKIAGPADASAGNKPATRAPATPAKKP